MRIFSHLLRGDSPQLNAPLLDRRRWPRSETPFDEAVLTWTDRWSERRMEVRVVNLSQGGAGLIVPTAPPRGAVLNLSLDGRCGHAAVEGRAVACRDDPETGWEFLHMEFTRGCPEHVLERLLGKFPEEGDE